MIRRGSEAVAGADEILPAGVVIDRGALTIEPVADDLMVELVGQVDRLEGQLNLFGDLVGGGGIDVEGLDLAFDIVAVPTRDVPDIALAGRPGDPGREPVVLIVERGVPRSRRRW